MAIVLYTDGAVRGNGTPQARASWAYVAVWREKPMQHQTGETRWERAGLVETDPKVVPDFIGAEKHTNNTGELSAIYWALRFLQSPMAPPEWPAFVMTDSKYAISMIRGEKAVHANKELVRKIRKLYFGLREKQVVTLKWVKGHVGIKFNERADELATKVLDG